MCLAFLYLRPTTPPVTTSRGTFDIGNTTNETKRIVKNLVDPNATCVTVTGEPGSGKTEMALQASKYLQERHRFGAIFFADCSAAVMAAASSAHPLLGRSVSASFADDLCGLVRVGTLCVCDSS